MVEVCIMCHNERSGEQVANTLVIRSIRRVKARLNMATSNTLVVCPGCLEAHARRLKSYERKMLLHAALAVILVILVIFVPLLAATFNPGSILVGLLMGGLIVALPLMDYVPPLASGRDVLAEIKEAKEAQARAAAQAQAASGSFPPSLKSGFSIPFFKKASAEPLAPPAASTQAAAPASAAAASPPYAQPPPSSSPSAAGVPPIWSSIKEARPRLWGKKVSTAKKSKPAHHKASPAPAKSKPAHSKSQPARHKSKPAHKRRR